MALSKGSYFILWEAAYGIRHPDDKRSLARLRVEQACSDLKLSMLSAVLAKVEQWHQGEQIKNRYLHRATSGPEKSPTTTRP